MGVREYLFGLLSTDPTLNGDGITADTLHANGEPDSPTADVFAILRWGIESSQGLGRTPAKGFDVALWVYDVDADYTRIKRIIKRWHELIESTPGQSTGDGWVIGLDWNGDGADGHDDAYDRYVRDSNYTIVASGE